MLSDLDKSVNCTLVKTIKEFKGMKANDVVKYIEGEPYVGIVPVEPGSTNAIFNDNSKIAGLNTENFEINEGLIRFDIIFYVRVPSKSGNNSNNENELSQVIINIEAQKDEPKKYQIINRAVFYRSVSVHPESHKPFHMLQQLSPHDIPAVQIPNLLQTGYMLFFPVVLFFSMFHCQM